jgi:hypothetical protein
LETILRHQWIDLRLRETAMISREQRTPLSEWWWTVDRLQLAAIIALMLAGVILSLAASPPVATRIGLDPFHFFNRHVLFLVPSFFVMIAVSFLSPRQIRRSALIVFAIAIVLIVATLLVGPEVKGARRWITLLGVNIQASEAAKPAFVVLAAWLFAESTGKPEMPATSMALVLLLTLVSLLVAEPLLPPGCCVARRAEYLGQCFTDPVPEPQSGRDRAVGAGRKRSRTAASGTRDHRKRDARYRRNRACDVAESPRNRRARRAR